MTFLVLCVLTLALVLQKETALLTNFRQTLVAFESASDENKQVVLYTGRIFEQDTCQIPACKHDSLIGDCLPLVNAMSTIDSAIDISNAITASITGTTQSGTFCTTLVKVDSIRKGTSKSNIGHPIFSVPLNLSDLSRAYHDDGEAITATLGNKLYNVNTINPVLCKCIIASFNLYNG